MAVSPVPHPDGTLSPVTTGGDPRGTPESAGLVAEVARVAQERLEKGGSPPVDPERRSHVNLTDATAAPSRRFKGFAALRSLKKFVSDPSLRHPAAEEEEQERLLTASPSRAHYMRMLEGAEASNAELIRECARQKAELLKLQAQLEAAQRGDSASPDVADWEVGSEFEDGAPPEGSKNGKEGARGNFGDYQMVDPIYEFLAV